jgi:hypothetical protein
VAVGDFNGDGNLDLAVTDNGNLSGSGTAVSILLGNGDGTFQAPVSYPLGSRPYFLVARDFNGDGNLDLAVGTSGSVSVLLGNGDGTFQDPVGYAVTGIPSSMAVGDFDGDGTLDLVETGGSNMVSVLLGNGDGTFRTAVSYPAGVNPIAVAVGDFNGDGSPDIAVADNGNPMGVGSAVTVLLGNGDGTFRPAVSYPLAIHPRAVAVGDFNGDGSPDIAVVSYADTLSILLSKGDGTFQAPLTYAPGSGLGSLAVGDFNGDGFPDIAVANGNIEGTVTVLLNAADWGGGPPGVRVKPGTHPLQPAAHSWGSLHIPAKTIIPDSGDQSSLAIPGDFCKFTDDRVHIEGVRLLQELESTLEIDVLPGDGGDLYRCFRAMRITGPFLMLQEGGKDRGVEKGDAAGDQAAAFRPDLLLVLGLAEAGVEMALDSWW